MNIPDFHDGHFDGLWLGRDKIIRLFLRSNDQRAYTLSLQGVQALSLSGVKEGNIILDLVLRNAREATSSDVEELYELDADSDQSTKLLNSMRKKKLQILELNPSYGAQGLFLFESFEISEHTDRMTASLGPVAKDH